MELEAPNRQPRQHKTASLTSVSVLKPSYYRTISCRAVTSEGVDEGVDDRHEAAAMFPSTDCPVPPRAKEMSTGRGSFGSTSMTSSYVSYLGGVGSEMSTRRILDTVTPVAIRKQGAETLKARAKGP